MMDGYDFYLSYTRHLIRRYECCSIENVLFQGKSILTVDIWMVFTIATNIQHLATLQRTNEWLKVQLGHNKFIELFSVLHIDVPTLHYFPLHNCTAHTRTRIPRNRSNISPWAQVNQYQWKTLGMTCVHVVRQTSYRISGANRLPSHPSRKQCHYRTKTIDSNISSAERRKKIN